MDGVIEDNMETGGGEEGSNLRKRLFGDLLEVFVLSDLRVSGERDLAETRGDDVMFNTAPDFALFFPTGDGVVLVDEDDCDGAVAVVLEDLLVGGLSGVSVKERGVAVFFEGGLFLLSGVFRSSSHSSSKKRDEFL